MLFLLNMYVARSRAHPEQRPSAVDLAPNLLVRIAYATLHRHLDGLTHVHRTGTGGNVRVKRGIRREAHMHIARAGMNFPRTALRAFRSNIAAPGFTAEATLHSMR